MTEDSAAGQLSWLLDNLVSGWSRYARPSSCPGTAWW